MSGLLPNTKKEYYSCGWAEKTVPYKNSKDICSEQYQVRANTLAGRFSERLAVPNLHQSYSLSALLSSGYSYNLIQRSRSSRSFTVQCASHTLRFSTFDETTLRSSSSKVAIKMISLGSRRRGQRSSGSLQGTISSAGSRPASGKKLKVGAEKVQVSRIAASKAVSDSWVQVRLLSLGPLSRILRAAPRNRGDTRVSTRAWYRLCSSVALPAL